MNTLVQSSLFAEWLLEFRDQKGKALILKRLASAALGNFGDCAPVGEGVSEMRIHTGPVTVFIMCARVPPFICCCAAATRARKGATSAKPLAWRGS